MDILKCENQAQNLNNTICRSSFSRQLFMLEISILNTVKWGKKVVYLKHFQISKFQFQQHIFNSP